MAQHVPYYKADLFEFSNLLTKGEKEVLEQIRKVLKEKIEPVVNEHWEKATFPYKEFKELAKTGLMNDDRLYVGRKDKTESQLFNFFKYYELAKVDASIATFYTVHGGLFRQTIILGGSPEQQKRWLNKAENFEIQGCFGLTEPDHGSDIAGGLATTAEKVGDHWILNGEKRWIGGAYTADEIPVFARSVHDNQVKCFMVPGKAEGVHVDVIQNKIALRLVQNGHITLTNVKVDDDRRLVNINSFKDVSEILKRTRAEISYLATGIAAGAFEAALEHTKNRIQFGVPTASFQLVQEKLARMAANVNAAIAYSVALAQQQEAGNYREEVSALAKMHNSLVMRETVALAREVVGGNGITLETGVARFFADAEAIYSYEGTHEINALLVGRYFTGIGAFVTKKTK